MKTSVRDALARGAAQLQAAGIESPRLDARVLLSQALDVTCDGLFTREETAPAQLETFVSLIARRAAREPLAYITGRKEFWSLEFAVGPGVLIPRPETETLIEEALRVFPDTEAPLRVLDIGTGSGCLILSLLKERPNATGLAVDISDDALACARRNAARLGVATRCCFEPVARLPNPASTFDLILANPPYLTDQEFAATAPEIRCYEPPEAFVAGADGLEAYRAFLPLVAGNLLPSGSAFFEIGTGQAEKVTEIVMGAGLEVRRAISDLSGIPRCLVIGRAGEGSPLAPLKKSVGKEPATR